MKRILDTAEIDTGDNSVMEDLYTDMRRMDQMTHEFAPDNANAYRVTVRPNPESYMSGFHRFIFNIQYGVLEGDRFTPLGEADVRGSERLPLL